MPAKKPKALNSYLNARRPPMPEPAVKGNARTTGTRRPQPAVKGNRRPTGLPTGKRAR